MATVVFLHAHPDDEAIFTGGTMALLAGAGHRVVLVVATRGEEGEPRAPLAPGTTLAEVREAETCAAADELGVARVVFLDYRDSGMAGRATNVSGRAFAAAAVEEAAAAVAGIVAEEAAAAVVGYDERGIYGHPDHIAVCRVARAAAAATAVGTVYEATVDAEYLHFVDTHLVTEAARLARPHVGVSTVELDLTLDVRSVAGRKARAMLAHASQIPEQPWLRGAGFDDVYGYEWYLRRGPRSVLDEVADHLGARV